jgi:hypothetical protein
MLLPSQLAVLPQHGTALIINAPTLGGERRAATQETVPRHAARLVAIFRSGRPARRQLGEVNGI